MSQIFRFAQRQRPFVGESLSSWRQRTALANGFSLFPVPPGALRRVDPDLGANQDELTWLSDVFDIAQPTLRSCSLQAWEGRVFAAGRGRSHLNWILRTRYSGSWLGGGPVFCPMCLAEQQEDYFRLSWRLGFITECPAHRCEMIDACPECGAAIWPAGATDQARYADRSLPIGLCSVCIFELRTAVPRFASDDVARELVAVHTNDGVALSPDSALSEFDYLSGLRALCHLFLRHRPNNRIRASGSRWVEMAELLQQHQQGNQIELMQIQDRRLLIQAVVPLLRDWPKAFLSFADAVDVSQEHFSGADAVTPEWMLAVVRKHLRKQIRGTRVEEVLAAIETVKNEGRTVTQASVSKALGHEGSGLVHHLLGRRTTATQEEFGHVLSAFRAQWTESFRRRSSLCALYRDQIVIMVAAQMNTSIESSSSLTGEMLLDWVRRVTDEAILAADAHDFVQELLARYLEATMARRTDGSVATSRLMVTLRDGTPHRSAARRLHAAMAELDSRLFRGAQVLHRAIVREYGGPRNE